MANRFLETNYYKSPFVRGLKGALKGLYSFIICDCTGAGIWALDLEAASMYIGFTVTMDEFDNFFIKKGKAIDLGNGKYFFPDFIEHQYPSGLQHKNIAHKNIISELKRLNLIDDNNCVFIKKNQSKNERGFEGALKGLNSPTGNAHGNGNGNGNVLAISKNTNNTREPIIPTKENVWEIFQRGDGTKEMAKSFYEKHEGTGWFINGSPITNFIPLANKFIDNWKRNENKKLAVVDSTNVKIKLK